MYKKYSKGMDSGYMGMISKDRSKVANMPQEVIQKEYPPCRGIDMYGPDDSIKGIDETINDSVSKIKSNKSKSMY